MTALTGGLGGGGLAEYAVAKEIYTVHRSPEVSAAEGACLPIAALTAYTALTKSAKIELHKNAPQKNILITAASGGVGLYAVQLAKLGNNHVTATCGARNIDLVKTLGADEVLDYNTPEGESLKSPSGRKYDAVIHCTEARRAWSIFEANLSGDGVVVDLTPGVSDFLRYGLQRVWFTKKKLVFLFVGIVNDELKYMVDLVKEGKIKSVIEFKCRLSEGGDGWRKMISGHATGKIVVEQ
ncbi:hypothetical protein ACJIZ3_017732 [Penstemon smallii]|uniref:Enoyl reductase (ER) domain-containing protein n=1 Tax=Penstemon smallii TaxID=265156 RepID=A0ABD3SWU5_9LAMI